MQRTRARECKLLGKGKGLMHDAPKHYGMMHIDIKLPFVKGVNRFHLIHSQKKPWGEGKERCLSSFPHPSLSTVTPFGLVLRVSEVWSVAFANFTVTSSVRI
jgi:hypothetical protein